MLSKNQIKLITSLKRKTERTKNGLFIAEGEKIVAELLLQPAFKIRHLCATKNWIRQNPPVGDEWNNALVEVSQSELQRISSLTTPNEVLAVCEIPGKNLSVADLEGKLSIALEGVQDPGNLGTLIRIADWFGIEHLLCSEDTVDVYNPKVIQATMGSFLRVKTHYTDLFALFGSLSLPKIGATLGGENLYTMKLPSEGVLVMGNESKGISERIAAICEKKISIPNFSLNSTSRAESLNVAVATAVICAEFSRQKTLILSKS